MKKITRLLTVAISSVLLFGCLACGGKDQTGNTSETQSGYKQYFPDTSFEPEKLTSNGEDIGNYRIVISAKANKVIKFGADELKKYIQSATGKTLEIVSDTMTPTENEIVLGKTTRTECESVNFDELGEESFKIKNVGKKLLISANDKRGILYGVYAYLEALGYRFYDTDVEKIPSADRVFVAKDVDLSWTPVFTCRDTRIYNLRDDPVLSVKLRNNGRNTCEQLYTEEKYGGSVGYVGGGAYMVHTFFSNRRGIDRGTSFGLLPSSLYTTHPEYFALIDKGEGVMARALEQPCLTNPQVYEIVLSNTRRMCAAYPDLNFMSISENDGGLFCQCDNCKESYSKYGVSGTMLNFVNAIAEELEGDFPNITFETLAYTGNDSQTGTKTVPLGGVKPRDNVAITLCIGPCMIHQDRDECEILDKTLTFLESWSKVTDKINIYNYFIPWNTPYSTWPIYESLRQIVVSYANNNVMGVSSEGYPYECAEFAELKSYLLCKLLSDPFMSKDEFYYHMYDFLQGYYGEGWKEVLSYINITVNLIKAKGERLQAPHFYDNAEPGLLFDFPTDKDGNFELDWIDEINNLWDTAEGLSNGAEYDRVKKSRIHWTYAELCRTFEDRYRKADASLREDLEMRNEMLYRDIMEYKTLHKSEYGLINDNITFFGISPALW